MDLTSLVLHRIVPRVFVVAGAGGRHARLATERVIRTRGWRASASPGEANMLVLCAPEHHGLDAVMDRLWDQMPGPRARTHIATADEAEARLTDAVAVLGDVAHQRHDAAGRSAPGQEHPQGQHDMAQHGDHEMGGMQVAGRAMAGRAEDRDGLKLDQLHVPLGPALPDWPAGLVVWLTLQGDVVQQASVELQPHGHGATTPSRGPAEWLDSLQRLLSVAGWQSAAVEARRLRDDWANDPAGSTVRRDYRRWSRRVRRSRLLRWSTDGVGVLAGHVPEALRGDATARWMRWLDEVDAGLVSSTTDVSRGAVDALPVLLVGQEFAATRLIVASLDPDVEALTTSRDPEPAHG